MGNIRATWSAMLEDRVSVTRMGGYGLLWLWTIMMFNSLVPYFRLPSPRDALYAGLTLSLVTMVVTMLFVAVALGRGERLSDNRFILWGAAAAMAAGSLLAVFGEPGTSFGMGALVFSSVLTGSGSAALFVCWGEQFFGTGGRVALAELAVGSCVSFIVGFFLTIVPSAAAVVVIVGAPSARRGFCGRTAWPIQHRPRRPSSASRCPARRRPCS